MEEMPTPFTAWPKLRAQASTAASSTFVAPRPEKRSKQTNSESARSTAMHSALQIDLAPAPMPVAHVRHIAGLLRSIAAVISPRPTSQAMLPSRVAHPILDLTS